MPRDGSGVFSLPSAAFVPSTTIASAAVNADFSDLVSDANNARPVTAGGTGGTSVIGGHDVLVAAGANVASGTSIALDAVSGPLIDITGTTTISTVTLGAGKFRVARATGAFQLTASANLVVNRSASVNYTTTAGDLLIFEGYAGSVVYVWVVSVAFASAADYRANVAGKVLTTDVVWSAAGLVTLTDAATVAVDMSTFINATVTLGGNRQLGTPSNVKAGQTGVIYIVQDGTGTRTLSYGANWKFAGGTAPTLSTAAGSVDRLAYFARTSTHIDGDLSKARS